MLWVIGLLILKGCASIDYGRCNLALLCPLFDGFGTVSFLVFSHYLCTMRVLAKNTLSYLIGKQCPKLLKRLMVGPPGLEPGTKGL